MNEWRGGLLSYVIFIDSTCLHDPGMIEHANINIEKQLNVFH